MFLLRKPPPASIQAFIESQHREAFSYPEVGATRHGAPAGYTVDHNRVRLGAGEEAFDSAVAALRRWEMFHLGWVELCWPDAPVETGTTVAILARHRDSKRAMLAASGRPSRTRRGASPL